MCAHLSLVLLISTHSSFSYRRAFAWLLPSLASGWGWEVFSPGYLNFSIALTTSPGTGTLAVWFLPVAVILTKCSLREGGTWR